MGQGQSAGTAGSGGAQSESQNESRRSSQRQPDDLYELLGVDQDATGDDIKKAFRKLALREHPDKVPGDRRNEANERFAKILKAFEVLSDDQERAWYDRHRDGFGAQPEEDLDVRSTPSTQAGSTRRSPKVTTNQLLRFFNITARMDDSSNGFFSQYRTLFELIVADEAQTHPLPGETLDPMPNYPSFGSASWSYDSGPTPIRTFYSSWLNFSTRKNFTEVDRFDAREAPDRRYKRAMEKENLRLREQAKRDFNETVRALVSFLKKRDPRFLRSTAADPLRAKAQEIERVKAELAKASKAAAERRAQLAKEYQTPSWAQAEGKTRTVDSDGDLTGSDEDDEEVEEIRCEACDKSFRSEGAWENHERSRKHLQTVKHLRRQLLAEEKELGIDSAIQSRTESPAESESEAEEATQAVAEVSIEPSEDEDEDAPARPQVGKKAKRAAERRARAAAQTQEAPAAAESPTPDEPSMPADDTPTLTKREKRRAKEAAKKAAASPNGTKTEACNVCGTVFDSRSKLFAHINDTGHALAAGYRIVDDEPDAPAPARGKRKGKR